MTFNNQPLIQGESRFEQTQLNIEKDNWNWCEPARYDGEHPATGTRRLCRAMNACRSRTTPSATCS